MFFYNMLAQAVNTDRVNTMESFAKFLQAYGGWGMAVVLIIAFIAYYRHQTGIRERDNDKFIELLRECSAILGQAELAHTKAEEALRATKQTMEDNKRVLQRVEHALDER